MTRIVDKNMSALDNPETTAFAQYALCIMAVALMAFLPYLSNPRLDPSEPPLVKPRVPLVGHLLGLMTSRVSYFSQLYERTNLPIATLPIMNKKLYVIFSAPLQQSAMRSKNMEPEAFTANFIPRIFGIKQGTLDAMLGRDGIHESMSGPMQRVFQTTLSGDALHDLTLSTMDCVADTLNIIGGRGLEVPNLYMWLREVMSYATSVGLFGRENNPYGKDPTVIDAQWDFADYMAPLMLGILPSIVARSAHLARTKVSNALEPYYRQQLDQDSQTSAFVRTRTNLIRQYGLPIDEISKNEVSVMLAATSNTIPILFWYISNIFLRPDLIRDLRSELTQALELQRPSGTEAIITIKLAHLETKCPLLTSCYRESVRLASQIITFRQAREDTVVTDGGSGGGRSYLLRAGSTVMMPARAVHRHRPIWGADADEFDARRFVVGDDDDEGDAEGRRRLRKVAWVPFGGGRHLCPGRRFALAENLGFAAVLVLGFEVVGLLAERIRMVESRMGEAAKPAGGWEGGPVVVGRREGWEGVTWKFAL